MHFKYIFFSCPIVKQTEDMFFDVTNDDLIIKKYEEYEQKYTS